MTTTPASPPIAEEAPSSLRRPRKQVSRACDWCRARKIRCDNAQPCKACRQRNAQCTHKGVDDEPRTLPQALREIERLKQRVRELEAKLHSSANRGSIPTPDHISNFSSPGFDSHLATPLQTISPPPAFSSRSKPQWRGIYVDTARSDQPSYYGASSSFYFVSRIGGYLGKALQLPCADQAMQLPGPSKKVHLDAEARGSSEDPAASVNERPRFMSRSQEESLLRLFWEGYHCIAPVIDEVEFRKHYASLWEPSRACRKPSPLVDIILALCLQYGYAYIPQAVATSTEGEASLDDATIAGRWYYRRSQSLLMADLESPSISTVQSYIFASMYLCCASFQNMSHIITAQAIRTAQVLGLHVEPPADMPHGERELRKRIWWAVWMSDTKISYKLGRPFLVDRAQVTATMFSDDIEAASYNGATLGSYGPNVTWLSYAIHNHRLFHTMMDIYDPLWGRFGEVISQNGLSCVYTDPDAVETCAKLLATKLPAIKSWVDNVPVELKMQRRGGGEPYSTGCLAVEIEALAPTWLQRQRVCLELTYHNVVINLTRPFITFYSHPGTYTPVAERHATTCVDHAVSFTLIMHQIVTESDLMSGWSEYFSVQWNAAITLVGFVLAYPIHQATLKARNALDKAVAVFDVFGANFAATAWGNTDGSNDGLAWLDPSQQDGFGQFMDWALSVDSFNSFERFFNPGNPADL
ncbi:fungal-specific transcription factor domain-containing protein [Dactylonectria macrodidyma]|uniref:Fungal-specific transcription factor domain-containing protein n=1 Tax=Dactylonectria macrodidyma TaxID=307937 RepID=A0A9P9FNK9_9HYPO|nr:fungal-specific transcription factor domain-containing protein [Dactylonectria macrodidyma]